MIGYLKGRVIEKVRQQVLVDVRDVGYGMQVGEGLSQKMGVGDEVELYVYTNVKENAIDLYGFEGRAQVDMFEAVISVSGVGPKIGMAILGTKSLTQIEKAVRDADVRFFQSVPGIGKKGAQKIIVELKGKLPSVKELDLSEEEVAEDTVYQALMQFGFSRAEVQAVLKDVDEGLSEEERVREGFRRLGRK